MNTPSTEKPTTVTSGPSTSSSTSASAAARRRRARSRPRRGAAARSSTSVSPFWPCRSGALTTTGPATSGSGSSPPTTHERGCGTPACREPLALAQLVRREHRRLRARSDAAGRARSAIRAATPTGQSVPGEIDPVDLERAGEPLDRRLVLGREDAAAVGEAEAGRRRVAVDDGDPEAARARRLEQPELCGARP